MEYIKPPLSSARNIKQLAYCEYKATNPFKVPKIYIERLSDLLQSVLQQWSLKPHPFEFWQWLIFTMRTY